MSDMHYSVVYNGQTIIPDEVCKALNIQSGDKVQYQVQGDCAILRAQPSLSSLRGSLASKKGRSLSFAQIRRAAAKNHKKSVGPSSHPSAVSAFQPTMNIDSIHDRVEKRIARNRKKTQ